VPRKKHVWIAKPNPGSHPVEMSMPVLLVIRDMLKLCDTAAEAQKVLSARQVLVDGRVITDRRFPVGLMDVVSVPKINLHMRMLVDKNGKLRLVPVPEGRQNTKICRINGKSTVKGGKTQLNLHDGRCIIVDKGSYESGDSIKIEVPSQKILETYKMAKGSFAMVTTGAHAGEVGNIEEVIVVRSSAPNQVKMKDGLLTVKPNIFVIGTKAPEVALPEGSAL
jgi:small subunit ribosomal protein S4e